MNGRSCELGVVINCAGAKLVEIGSVCVQGLQKECVGKGLGLNGLGQWPSTCGDFRVHCGGIGNAGAAVGQCLAQRGNPRGHRLRGISD